MFQRSKNLHVEYAHNASAWMTSSIFEDYLRNWDRQLNKRKIALVLVNFPAHPKLNSENIELTFLTSKHYVAHQPLDQEVQGVVIVFKKTTILIMRR
jgi:hypothetical protein